MQLFFNSFLILCFLLSNLSPILPSGSARGGGARGTAQLNPAAPETATAPASVQTSLAAANRVSDEAAPSQDFTFSLQPKFLRAGKDVRLNWSLSPYSPTGAPRA